MSNFFFSHSVFKKLVPQTRKNQGLFGKGLKSVSSKRLSNQCTKNHLLVLHTESEHSFCNFLSIFFFFSQELSFIYFGSLEERHESLSLARCLLKVLVSASSHHCARMSCFFVQYILSQNKKYPLYISIQILRISVNSDYFLYLQ